MDWKQKYLEKSEANKQRWQDVINSRMQRFRVNPPLTKEHLSELEYLIVNYDYKKTLLKRYANEISEDAKTKWLEKNLRGDSKYTYANFNIYRVLIPFYLINPKTKNPKIDKHFLDDQLMLILGSLDHKFRKYRWRANSLFEFLTPNLGNLNFYLRERLIKLLITKTTNENIHEIKIEMA